MVAQEDAWLMALTHDQLVILQADMAADPLLSNIAQNSDTAVFVAEAYNLTASPVYWVYRTPWASKKCMKLPRLMGRRGIGRRTLPRISAKPTPGAACLAAAGAGAVAR